MNRIVRNYFLFVFGLIGFSAVCAIVFWFGVGLMDQVEPLRPIADAIRGYFVNYIVAILRSQSSFERNPIADAGFMIMIIVSIIGWIVINHYLKESDKK